MNWKRFLLVVGAILIVLSGFALEAKLLPFCTSSIERMPWLFEDVLYFVGNNYDIYQIVLKEDGSWGEIKQVEGEVNTLANEISPCVVRSGDDLVMYFARYSDATDYDFFRAVLDMKSGEWIGVTPVKELNTDTQEWKIWVNEGETLAYITTKGSHGGVAPVGGRDIWMSEKVEGKWTTPLNVAALNTAGDEWSVFVDPLGRIWIDGSREEVLGGHDIYYYDPQSKKIVHPGEDINTMYNDRSVWTDGKTLILSSSDRKGGAGSYDLYTVDLEGEVARPAVVVEAREEITATPGDLRASMDGKYVLEGQTVTVEGVALVSTGEWHDKANYFAIADASAGVFVYGAGFIEPFVRKGDLVRVTGTLSIVGYSTDIGSLVILPSGPEDIVVLSNDADLPAPKILFSDTSGAALASYEARPVMFFGKVSQYDNETIARGFAIDGSSDSGYDDSKGEVKVKFYSYAQIDISGLENGDYASVKGVLVLDKEGNYYVRPTEKSDISELQRNRLIFLSTVADRTLVTEEGPQEEGSEAGNGQILESAADRIFASASDGRLFLSAYSVGGTRAGNGPAIYEYIDGALVKLALPGEAEYPDVKGNKLVFACRISPDDLNSSWEIYHLDLESKKLQKLLASPSDEIEPVLSPDGERVVFSRQANGRWELVELETASGRESVIEVNAKSGDFSSDGGELVFQHLDESWDLVELSKLDSPIGLSRRKLLATPFDETSPAVNDDSNLIAFVADYRGKGEVFLLDTTTGEVRPLFAEVTESKNPFWIDAELGVAKRSETGWEMAIVEVAEEKIGPFEEVENFLHKPRLTSPAMVDLNEVRFEISLKEGFVPVKAYLQGGGRTIPVMCNGNDAIVTGSAVAGLYDLRIVARSASGYHSWIEPKSVYLGDSSRTVRIVQLTDIHLGLVKKPENREGFIKLLEGAKSEEPTMIVITGDVSDAAQYYPDDYAFLRSALIEHAECPVFVIPGNHDSQRAGKVVGKEVWTELFGELYFGFEWGGWRYIFLDTGDSDYGLVSGMVSEEQMDWLRREVGKDRKKTVLFAHHNPFDTRWSFFEKESNRQELVEVLEGGNLMLALFGHRHSDAIDYHDEILAITTRKSLEGSALSYRLVILDREGIVKISQELPKASKSM